MSSQSSRLLAIFAAFLFFVSTAFPLAAGLSHNPQSLPKWWGILDVSLAVSLGILATVILGASQRNVDRLAEELSYRAYRVLTHGILLVLIVFFLAGDRIVWRQCLSGLAWRVWLLLYTLPAWVTAARSHEELC